MCCKRRSAVVEQQGTAQPFLAPEKDQARQRIREDFNHLIHQAGAIPLLKRQPGHKHGSLQVPAATHDSRQWPKLDQVRDEELESSDRTSMADLRHDIAIHLSHVIDIYIPTISYHIKTYHSISSHIIFVHVMPDLPYVYLPCVPYIP